MYFNVFLGQFWCDYVNDCPDRSDEKHCPNHRRECRSDEFLCDNGQCINEKYRCFLTVDHRLGCADKSNLKNCSQWQCSGDQIKCADSYCVDGQFKCNGKIECPIFSDWADEENCRKSS